MLEFQSKSTVYSVRQSSEKYLAPEEVLREMYIGKKKFNLNSPLDKDFIEGHLGYYGEMKYQMFSPIGKRIVNLFCL